MEYQSSAVSPIKNIEEGWNLVKDNYLMYVLMALVFGAIVIVVALVVGGGSQLIMLAILAALGMPMNNPDQMREFSQGLIPNVVSIILGFFVNIIIGTITGALTCGVYASFSRTQTNGTFDFSDLFAGFQKLTDCLVVSVILAAIQIGVQIVYLTIGAAVGFSALGLKDIIFKDGHINPAIFTGLIGIAMVFVVVSIIISLVTSALTAFIYPLIIERDLSAGAAFVQSIKGGAANLIGLILLFILLGLMSIGGFILCIIGILFVIPIIWGATFAAYQSVFGRKENTYQQNPPPPPNFGFQQGY